MKISTLLCAALLTVFSAVTALASDVSGTWSGQMSGPNGESFDLSFTFKQDGAKLTGTVAGPQGDPLTINEGKVEGEKLSFSVSFNDMTFQHTGEISGDEIKLTTKASGDFPGGTITLKRAK